MTNRFKTDPHTAAFVKAAGITGGTEFMAVNYLVIALKTNNLWNRIFALYPFVGGNATAHKFNLVNPLDTNGAYRLTFSGATHNSNGVTYSLTNGGSNTFLTPTVTFQGLNNKETLALYSRSPFSSDVNGTDMGAAVAINQRDSMAFKTVNGTGVAINSTTSGAGTVSTTATTNGSGFIFASRQTSTDLRLYKDGVLLASATTTNDGTRANIPIYIGCRNVTNVPQNFTGRNIALALIAAEYTPAEAATFSTIVEQYQTYLNRSAIDADANSFLITAGVTAQTQVDAIYTLVRQLKENNLWNKCTAIYPMVGGTSVTHSYNLKNPAQYRITWNGTVTHTANGATGNGTNGYGNTGILPSTALTQNDTHISYYSRTNTQDTTAYREWGAIGSGAVSNKLEMLIRFNDTLRNEINATGSTVVSNTVGACHMIGSRTSSTGQKAFLNGNLISSDSNPSSGLPNVSLYLMALNNNGSTSFWGKRECAFASVGQGFTDAEAATFYSIIQTYQTTLGRQV